MKVYFANMFGAKGLESYLRYKINILAAYPSFGKRDILLPPYCSNLFVDSGAFTKNHEKIILSNYISFIKQNADKIKLYANLDVIGDAAATWRNQIIMEKEELTPLPVFHYKNNIKWLYKLLNEYPYIAFGGLVPISKDLYSLRIWLDTLWKIVETSDNPKIKIHGFGILNIDIAKRYPWFSIDSSSVHLIARYGGIYSPYGTFKINPKVNSKEMEWQIKTPMILNKIKSFVLKNIDAYSFEEAQEQSTKGTLIRTAISIHYLTEELK